MSKWVFNLKFDFRAGRVYTRSDGNDFTKKRGRVEERKYTGIIRTFHKDSDVEWMKKIIEKEKRRMEEDFKPSYSYFIEFVGDKFIGKEEYNILLETNMINRREITIVAKAYSQENASKIANALNAVKPDLNS